MIDTPKSGNLLGGTDARMYRGLLLRVQEAVRKSRMVNFSKQYPEALAELKNFLVARELDLSESTMFKVANEAGITFGPVSLEMFEKRFSQRQIIKQTVGQARVQKRLREFFENLNPEILHKIIKEDHPKLLKCSWYPGEGPPAGNMSRMRYVEICTNSVPLRTLKATYANINNALQRGDIKGYKAGTTLKEVWDSVIEKKESAPEQPEHSFHPQPA